MIDPKVDELSMMTYLSQYPNAKLKPGAPLKPKVNVSRIRCFGKGLEPNGNNVDAPAKFSVETFNAGKGDLEVFILNPKGIKEPVSLIFSPITFFFFLELLKL
jgi:filamin